SRKSRSYKRRAFAMTVFSSSPRWPTMSGDGFGVNTGRLCGARRSAEASPCNQFRVAMALARRDVRTTADERLEALERGQAEILAGQTQLLAGQARILRRLE